jgi:cathepsin X
MGDDIHLSIQYILNCGTNVAGSCLGGTPTGAYQFIHDNRGFVPYETCQPYLACSADSQFGICPHVDTSCTASNICKTCTMKIEPSLHPFGEVCREIDHFPNATVAEYGVYSLSQCNRSAATVMELVQAELFARGPVTAAVHGAALHEYRGGIYSNVSAPTQTTHSVSIVGWGTHNSDDNTTLTHWIVRNSWGQYFGGECARLVAWGLRILCGTRIKIDFNFSVLSCRPRRNGLLSYPGRIQCARNRNVDCLGHTGILYHTQLAVQRRWQGLWTNRGCSPWHPVVH